MSRIIERCLPVCSAVVFGVGAAIADAHADAGPLSGYVSAGTMALGLIVAGFTATHRNMLLGMGGSRVLRHAANTGYYKDVLSYLAHCIYAGLLVTLVSLAGIFVDRGFWIWPMWLALWVGSIILVVALLIRSELLMSRIFAQFMKEQAKRKN